MIVEKDDSTSLATAVTRPSRPALQPFQLALLEQAVARLSEHFDSEHSLLSHPLNPGFKPIRESLCYAALLLARSGSQHVTESGLVRARKIIDAVLARQNRNTHGASGGAFPLAWSQDKQRGAMDPDSRQIVGTLLAVLLRDYGVELGPERCTSITRAIDMAVRCESVDRLERAHQRQLKTWLEFEHGDRMLGEELLVAVTDPSGIDPAQQRFGDPQGFCYELWAGALWQQSARLDEWGKRLQRDLFADIATSMHPTMHRLLGGGLLPRLRTEGGPEWVNIWLTWLALGSNPLLPRDVDNPLDASLLAFPALAATPQPEWPGPGEARAPISKPLKDRHISAWYEPDLHVEACQSREVAPGSEPVLAAFWQRETQVAQLICQSTGSHDAVCDGRSVRMGTPGKCRITISGLGGGVTRLVEDGWQLPGLRLTTRGFDMIDAERTPDGLSLLLRPVRDHGLLVFSPAA